MDRLGDLKDIPTNFPDPEADRGAHVLRWGLLPHDGCPLRNDVPAVAEAFAGRGLMPSTPREAPFTMRASAHVGLEVAAWKGAEDDRGRVLRLVEKHGGHGHVELAWPAAVRVTPCDLHEQHRELPGLVHEGTTTRVPLRPFGVVTLRIEDGA